MARIKINRATKLAKVGRYPSTCTAMVDQLPPSVVAALSSKQLGELLDAVWSLAEKSKALAERDACYQGRVWDARYNQHRELEPHAKLV